MDDMQLDDEARTHAASLDKTIRELQRRVNEHERELARLRASDDDDEAVLSPTAQAKAITMALTDLNESDPFLPFPGSDLPALLALRKTHQTTVESNAYITSNAAGVDNEKRQLDHERANLKDQDLLTDALEARIESLKQGLASKADMTPEDGVRERLEGLKKRKRTYDRDTAKLMKSLMAFIDDRLAPMLAAEELGGPVVGDVIDIRPEDLAAGFNSQGKLKKGKKTDGEYGRQRRLDEIWGAGEGGSPNGPRQDDEISAAGAEMKQLTEDLLNQLVEAKGDNSASYVRLGRESAAARFLVRSKVALFHPKDATRLRLIDFGRELEQ